MVRKLIIVVAAVGLLSAVPAAADTTVIGSSDQSSLQGVDSQQSASNSESKGIVLGTSAPTTTETSANVLSNGETIGGGDTTLIAASPSQCFCQANGQAVNSAQTGGGTETSINGLTNDELVGGIGDLVLIGGSSQANNQGANSTQSSGSTQNSLNLLVDGLTLGGGGSTTLIAPTPAQCFCQSSTQGANSSQDGGHTQSSANVLGNGELVGGGTGDLVLIGGSGQANNQGANSTQSGSGLDQTSVNLVIADEIVLGN